MKGLTIHQLRTFLDILVKEKGANKDDEVIFIGDRNTPVKIIADSCNISNDSAVSGTVLIFLADKPDEDK